MKKPRLMRPPPSLDEVWTTDDVALAHKASGPAPSLAALSVAVPQQKKMPPRQGLMPKPPLEQPPVHLTTALAVGGTISVVPAIVGDAVATVSVVLVFVVLPLSLELSLVLGLSFQTTFEHLSPLVALELLVLPQSV